MEYPATSEWVMHWIFVNIYQGINNVYSGWIWWNLFLAFVPMLLSFRLFRRKAIPPVWFAIACFATALIGIVGFSSRIPRFTRSVYDSLGAIMVGDSGALLNLLWFMAVLVIALGVSIWLFRRSYTSKVWLWWLGLAVFIAFLPNAPYVLTDIIHLIRGTSSGEIKIWVIALVFIPIHLTAMLVGFEAYVISLLNVIFFLKQRNHEELVLPTELTLHALCAIGIYLGRFIRLNSWDFLVDPTSVLFNTLNTLTDRRPLAVILVTFIILAVFYWVMKQVTLGLKLRYHYARKGMDPLV
jgi:uncharacterized membrane protein